MILHISSDHDIFARYSHENILAFHVVTVFKLFNIHCPDNDCHIVVYI
ncbi:MAG: hypothetical protein WCG25_06935 [bacterium]